MNRVAAEQTSAAASARGPASLALAQQGAAANTAAGQSTISNHTQINSAQERLAAEQAAMGAYSGMRGQDIGQSTAQGNLDAQQRGLNDQFKLGMTGYETGVQGAQLGAQRAQVAQAAQGAAQYQQIAAQRQAASDAKTGQMVGTVAQVGGTIVGSALGGPVGGAIGGAAGKAAGGAVSPGSVADGSGSNVPLPNYNQQSQGDPNDPYREHGGPVRAGKPYIVGERGPEMIVPERDGHVLTAEQTREATGGAGHGSRADAFLEGIHPLSYFYKHGDAEPRSEPTGGRYLGISAQDLEHVPDVGHQLVSDGPRGKQIESGPTLSAALAGLARLHERVKELEGGGEHITSDIRAKEDVVSEGRAPSPDALRAAYAAGAAREMNRDNPAGRPELPEYMQPRAAAPPSLARAYEAPRPAQPAEIRQTRPTRLESLRDTAAEMAGGVGGFLRETGAAVRDLPANLASFYRDDYPADHEPPPQREPAVMPGGPVASYRVGR